MLKVNPVVIGAGVPLFGGEFGARRFTLTDTLIGESVSIMTYARAS
ncbi:hypothetical protein [Streptomyces sp. NPDC005336]